MGEGSGVMPLGWKPPSVFYGWWIVFACFVISLYMAGVVFYGFTAIFEPIAGEFGWVFDTWGSYQGVWLAFAGLTIMGVIIMTLLPPVGAITQAKDRAS